MPKHSMKPNIELLEDRRQPAIFGVPWADAQHLTLSWLPDDTTIAGQTKSSLFQSLDAQRTTDVWQRDILRALQTWAAVAHINVGVVADSGQPLGSLTGGTAPAFGDIRVGAQNMPLSALAISIPHDPYLSGSWSGELLFNGAASLYSSKTDVYSIALHELGHIFGLSPSNDPASVMYNQATTPRTGLAASDIAAIRALYGARLPDLNEGDKGNTTFDNATRIKFEDTPDHPGDPFFDGTMPLIAYGDLTTSQDVDMFTFRTMEGYSGPVTIRLQTQGISLLAPQLSIYDKNGRLLGQVQATEQAGSVVTYQLANVDHDTFFLRVEAATPGEFAIGRYAIAITHDNLLTTPEANIQAVLRGAYEGLDSTDLMQLLRDPNTALLHRDDHTDDTVLAAVRLQGPAGITNPTMFQAIGSVQGPTDVDFYRVTAPRTGLGLTPTLNVTLQKADANGLLPKVVIYNRYLQPLATTVLSNGGGVQSLQVAGIGMGVDFYIKVFGDQTGSTANGNYRLDVRFAKTPVALNTFTQGFLSTPAKTTVERNLYIAQSQLFHLLLNVPTLGTTVGAGVRVTVTNAAGNPVYDLTALRGQTVSTQQLLLTPGTYKVRYSLVLPAGVTKGTARFLLKGDNLSDPIGPSADDPTRRTLFTSPANPSVYTYPGNVTTQRPYLWASPIV
jgi:predicted Zn-dependent protease